MKFYFVTHYFNTKAWRKRPLQIMNVYNTQFIRNLNFRNCLLQSIVSITSWFFHFLYWTSWKTCRSRKSCHHKYKFQRICSQHVELKTSRCSALWLIVLTSSSTKIQNHGNRMTLIHLNICNPNRNRFVTAIASAQERRILSHTFKDVADTSVENAGRTNREPTGHSSKIAER